MATRKTTRTRTKKDRAAEIIREISDISYSIPFIESLINNRNIVSADDRKYIDPLLFSLKKRAVKKAIVLSTLMEDSDED